MVRISIRLAVPLKQMQTVSRWFFLLAALAVTNAGAEEGAPAAPGDQHGFRCMAMSDLDDHEAGSQRVLVDHFSLRERDPLMGRGDLKVIEASYAVSNRTSDVTAEVDAGFLGLDEAMQPVFVVTATPTSFLVQPGTTEAAKGSIFVTPDTLTEIHVICVKVSVVLRSR